MRTLISCKTRVLIFWRNAAGDNSNARTPGRNKTKTLMKMKKVESKREKNESHRF